MIQTMKRGLALLMALVMCIGFLPMLQINTSAASVEYVYDGNGKYVYNWGTRGTEATFLSPMAEEFYENDTYDELSELKGGTNKDTAPASALYAALQKLMADNHTTITSYDDTRPLFQYTDCQNSGKDSKAISCFYSGRALGPTWDGGATWNREHTWPNSKGEGQGENDIMMLRPTASNVNSSRGNKAYGESSGYYNPNSASNNQYDLRGDVARIFLYVYVRWGQTTGVGEYTIWGSNGIIESLDILLAWMAADPVDTWELGRNDSVESITGTRNVFVDYPEYAFLLFGAEIPADMTTPSGENNTKCTHNNYDAGVVNQPTCVLKGYTLYTCQTAGCGNTYKDNFVAAKGHSYTEGTCSVCGAQEPAAPSAPTPITSAPEVGKVYRLGLYSTNKSSTYYFTGSVASTYYGSTGTDFDAGVDVFVEATTGGYHLAFTNKSGAKQYINLLTSGTHVNFTMENTASSVYTWDATNNALCTTVNGTVYYIGNYGTYTNMSTQSVDKISGADSYIARLYYVGTQQGGGTGGETPTPPPVEPSKPAYVSEFEVGKAYKLGLFSTDKNAEYYFTGTMSGYYGATDTDYSKGVDVFVESTTGGYRLYFMSGSTKQYINLVYSNSHYNFTFDTTATSVFTWDAAKSSFYTTVGTETCYIGTYGNYVTMGVLRMSEWSNNNYVARLYTAGTQQGGGTEDTSCANGHSYVDGVCSKCGAVKPTAASTATISFADKANRTEFNTSKQVWKQNGITVTNNKAGSSTSIGDYGDPARFYKSSSVTIEYPGMAKIEIDAVSGYIDPWLDVPAGATATKNNGIVTIVFDTPVNSFTYTSLSAQARADKITVYGAPNCDHAHTIVKGAVEATCTEAGRTGEIFCVDCETTITPDDVAPALGHNFTTADACSACGLAGYTVYFIVPNGANAIASTVCGTNGITLPESSVIAGYTFEGWATSAVNNLTEKPELLKAGTTFTTDADAVLYAVYSYEISEGGTATTGNASLSFSSTANRESQTKTQQVWKQNGITLTNDKASSTNDVANYSNPARFYANSKLTIEHAGMTKIVFTANSSTYATNLKNSIGTMSGVTVSVSSKDVTVTFANPQDSFVIAKLTAQVRMNSLKVYYTTAAADATVTVYYTTVIGKGACAHAETTVAEGTTATCTTAGYVNKLVCAKCEAELGIGKARRVLGHDITKYDAQKPNCTDIGWEAYEECSRCDYTTYVEIGAEGHNLTSHEARAVSCTDIGWNAYETCSKCTYSTYVEIDAKGHYLIDHKAQEATCTEKGWDAYQACADCNYTTYKEIPAGAHTVVKHEGKAATCTDKGWKAYETCSKCIYTTYQEIPATGHAWEAQAAVNATCTTEGNVAYDKCKTCGATSVADVIVPKTAHDLKHVAATEATTEAAGNVEYWQCESCGGIWTDEACSASSSLEDVVVPKLDTPVDPDPVNPDDPDDDEDDDEPTTEKKGFFARIWDGIVNFFKNLFGKKKN